mgnify:CR=1 FL=1
MTSEPGTQNPAASTNNEIGLFRAIYTMRAIRKFKPDPIPDEVIRLTIRQNQKCFVLRGLVPPPSPCS